MVEDDIYQDNTTQYCGACKHTYAWEATRERAGEPRTVFTKDDLGEEKCTIQIVFITCPYNHTVGARNAILEAIPLDDLPF